MKIKRFNEGNQNTIDYIKECFIDLVESSISDDMTIDDSFFSNTETTELGVSVCLPALGEEFIIKDNNELLSHIITYNNMVNDRYVAIMHCVEKVMLSYPNIEYHYEIMSTENEKISKSVYIPYMQYVEIIFKV